MTAMKQKTQQNPSNYDSFNVKTLYYTPPMFAKTSTTTQKHEKTNKKRCKSPSKSNEMAVTCDASNPNKWSLSSLINALPFTPSTACRSSSSSTTSCSSNGGHGSKSKSKLKSASSSSSYSSVHEGDFVPRASHEFFTPTHQLASVVSSTSFRKREQSPKRQSVSTIYESTFNYQGYMMQEKRQGKVSEPDTYSPKRLVPLATPPHDRELLASTTEICDRRSSYPLLPSGSKERPRRWSANNVRKGLEVSRDECIRPTKAQVQKVEGEKVVVSRDECIRPTKARVQKVEGEKVVGSRDECIKPTKAWVQKMKGENIVSRDECIRPTKARVQKGEGEKVVVEEEHGSHIVHPVPYQDFSDELQKHKRKVELDALYKAGYTDLLSKLKKKEADIDSWESNQRSKAELQLDRIERKLNKKKAEATQKIHQKVVEAKIEAERRKYRERESVMKKVAKLSQKSEGYEPSTSILCFPWSSGKSQYTSIATTPRAS